MMFTITISTMRMMSINTSSPLGHTITPQQNTARLAANRLITKHLVANQRATNHQAVTRQITNRQETKVIDTQWTESTPF